MSALMLDKPIQATKETLSFETPKALELASFIGELREISADERMSMLEVVNGTWGNTNGCSAPSNCTCNCKTQGCY